MECILNSLSINQEISNEDQSDAIPVALSVNKIDICVLMVSILSYIFDICMDIFITYYYYSQNQLWYFIITLIFILVPSVVMTAFSLKWYIRDVENVNLPFVSFKRWFIRIVMLTAQLGPVLRYIDSLIYALKCRKIHDSQVKMYYYKLMVFEDSDASLLRLFESFMESSPQVLLQLFIMLRESPVSSNLLEMDINRKEFQYVCLKILTVFSSLFSIAWSQVSYQRTLRFCNQHKRNISFSGTVIQTLWHFFSISSRMVALALFTSVYYLWVFGFLAAHWLLMTVWLLVQKTAVPKTYLEEFFFDFVLGFIYIFCYLNTFDAPTCSRYFIFYIVMFIENSILMILWLLSFDVILWLQQLVFGAQYCLFFLNILSMIIYYQCLHPNRVTKFTTVSCSKKTITV